MDAITLAMAKAKTDALNARLEKERKIGKEDYKYRGRTFFGVITAMVREEIGGLCGLLLTPNTWFKSTDAKVMIRWDEDVYWFVIPKNITGGWQLGNLSLGDIGEDTGEPFLILCDFDQDTILVITKNPGDYDVEVECYTETIHPIDPKYLPGVCLPVVELSTPLTEEGLALTEEEAAQVNAANGMPFILVAKDGTITLCGVAVSFAQEGVFFYALDTAISLVQIAPDGTGGFTLSNKPKE